MKGVAVMVSHRMEAGLRSLRLWRLMSKWRSGWKQTSHQLGELMMKESLFSVEAQQGQHKIANDAIVLHESKWAVYNMRMVEWWTKLKEWVAGAPARKMRAVLYNQRVQRMKVAQGSAAGWSEFRRVVWAMTVSMDSVMRSRVYRRMMSGVGKSMEEKLEEKVRQQRVRERQF